MVRVSFLCSRAGGKGPKAPGGKTRARACSSESEPAPIGLLVVAVALTAATLGAGCGTGNEAAPVGQSGISEAVPPPATSAPAETLPAETLPSEPTTEAVEAPLPDGRHFGFIKSINLNASPATMVFDLAYFLTGDEANAAAAKRGDEVPVPNDYYIVNDNPKLRTLQVSPNVDIELVDWNNCCDKFFKPNWQKLQDSFALEEPPMGRYKGKFSHYWLTVEDGQVVKIEEQFVP
jgi:hypothetical protein